MHLPKTGVDGRLLSPKRSAGRPCSAAAPSFSMACSAATSPKGSSGKPSNWDPTSAGPGSKGFLCELYFLAE